MRRDRRNAKIFIEISNDWLESSTLLSYTLHENGSMHACRKMTAYPLVRSLRTADAPNRCDAAPNNASVRPHTALYIIINYHLNLHSIYIES